MAEYARIVKAGEAAGADLIFFETYTDLYELGLSGTEGSAGVRRAWLQSLGLPPRLSKKELVEAFNRLYTFEQLDELQLKILQE